MARRQNEPFDEEVLRMIASRMNSVPALEDSAMGVAADSEASDAERPAPEKPPPGREILLCRNLSLTDGRTAPHGRLCQRTGAGRYFDHRPAFGTFGRTVRQRICGKRTATSSGEVPGGDQYVL